MIKRLVHSVDIDAGTERVWQVLTDLSAYHQFRIETLEGGASRLTQDETFSGFLVPIFARSLERHTLPAFATMNAALKARAERAMTPSS